MDNRKNKSLSVIPARTGKEVQDCEYVFGQSTKFQGRMNGFVIADICRQVSVCLHVVCGILFALKPFGDYSLCSVCILPQPAFYSQSVVFILHSVCILPQVRSQPAQLAVLCSSRVRFDGGAITSGEAAFNRLVPTPFFWNTAPPPKL